MIFETINSSPFLDESHAYDIYARTLSFFPSAIQKGPNYFFLGSPVDYGLLKKHHDLERINSHNEMMTSHFNDILEMTINFFESLLKEVVFTHPRLSLPGFNIFEYSPHMEHHPFFHHDRMQAHLCPIVPDISIEATSPILSFTVLLHCPKEFETGLLYFDHQDSFGDTVVKRPQNAHIHYKHFSKLFLYEVGKINFHNNPTHSIYSKNSSASTIKRITFQGHVVHTNKGWLIFW